MSFYALKTSVAVMDFWHGFLLITGVHLLAAASPGPDFVLVSQQTLARGRRTGLLCSLGITLGLAVHIVYSVLGLAAVIAHSQPLLTAIKWLGGAYLIYIGIQGLRAQPRAVDEAAFAVGTEKRASDSPALATIRRGFFCNVLNPKAPVYFVALFTLVLSPDMPLWQLSVYGVWMMVLQMAWFSTVVMLLSLPVINRRFQRSAHWVDRVLGGAMVVLGINVILRRG